MIETFTPFYDHRGIAVLGKPVLSEIEFNQMKERKRQMKLNSLKLQLNKATETPKLSLSKGTIAKESEITIEKLNRIESLERKVEEILKRLEGIHNAIGKQYETIASLNTELIPSIVHGMKTLNDMQSENNMLCIQALKSLQSKPIETTLRKGNTIETPKAIETPSETSGNELERLASLWRKHWTGNFCGSQEIELKAFGEFIAKINEDDLEKSFDNAASNPIGKAKYPIARVGKAKAFEGFKQALAEFQGNTETPSTTETPKPIETETPKASEVIDTKFFMKAFAIGLDNVQEIKQAWIDGNDTKANRQAVKDFIEELTACKPETFGFKVWQLFFNWLNAFKR
jgi:hypothetical protein